MNRSTWPTSRRRRRRRRGGGGERFFYCCGCHHQSCHYTLLLSSVQIEFKCFEFKSGLIPASIRRWWAMLSIGFLFCFVVSELISMALLLFDASVDGNCFCGLRASKPPRLIFTRPVDVAELSRRMRLYPLLPPPSTSSYTSKEKLCKWVFLNQCSRLSWTQLGVVPHITMPAWNSIGDDYRTQWYIARVRAVNYDRLRLDPNDRSPSNATAIDFQFHFQFDSQFHFQSQ